MDLRPSRIIIFSLKFLTKMLKYFYLTFLLSSICLSTVSSQTVSTWIANSGISDDMVYDNAGNIYGSGFETGIVYKLEPDGTITTFASGITNPNGLAFDDDQNLYVVGWGQRIVWKVDPSGNKEILINGVPNPSGLIRMPNTDTLLLTSPVNDRIDKLSFDGEIVPFISDSQLNAPVGMKYNDNGELIISNFSDNRIFRHEPDGSLSLIVNIDAATPAGIGFIECIGDFIYATMFSSNEIFRTDYNGNFVLVAGTGAFGSGNGEASMATFSFPNGILASPGGDSLYISDFGTGSVRLIAGLDLTNSINEILPTVVDNINLYPNPTSEHLSVELSVQEPLKMLALELVDVRGKVVFVQQWNDNFPVGQAQLKVSLPHLSSGTYMYKLRDHSRLLAGGKLSVK